MPVPDELDSFAEFSSDKFRNLDEVQEYHDNTAEFPMDIETDSAVLAGAAMGAAEAEAEAEAAKSLDGSEASEEEKRQKETSDRNTKEIIKNATNISTTQALAPVAAALVVTSAIIIPIIDNIDVEVNLNMEFVAGILSYSIEIINASEDETYEAFVYEGSSIIKETIIENGRLEDSIGGLPPYRDHRVEVRSGTPALYVLKTSTIPAAPSWAEWGHLTVGFDVIDYGVYYYGVSGEATITLVDPYDESVLYTKTLEEGLNSDIITGLRSSHMYTLTVASDTTLYLYEEVETEYTDVEWDHLTVIDNTIDYGVISDYSIENLTITLSDPETSSVVYTKDLLQGYDEDTIIELQFGHSYELTVANEEEIYLYEMIVTDSEPITVTVGHITPIDNTIDYEITVSGEGKTLTLSLYDVAGGPPIYTGSIKSGVNSKIIEGLQYSHGYLLTVMSSTKTYVSENVTTETEPTKVTLGHLKATQTTVDYEITVTGNRDIATAYLKDTVTDKVLYTKELKVGVNSAIIDKLEVNHTYQFTVSSKTETFINQNITTDPSQTEVVLNHLTVIDNTIDYEVTVTGTSDSVTAYLYDSEGETIYSLPLSIGSNTAVIRDLEYGSTYSFVVSSETKKYVEAAVTIEENPTEVILNDLSSNDNTISYDVTVSGTSVVLTAYLYDEDGTELYSKVLEEGTNTGDIEELEYQHTYQFTISSEERIYINETIGIEESFQVILNYLGVEGTSLDYNVTVTGNEEFVTAYLYGNDGVELDREDLWIGTNDGTLVFGIAQPSFLFVVKSSSKIYVSEEIIPPVYFNYLEGEGNTIKYSVTVTGSENAVMRVLDSYHRDPVVPDIDLPARETKFDTLTDLEWGANYFFHIYVNGVEIYEQLEGTDSLVEIKENTTVEGNVIHYVLEVTNSIGSTLEITIEDSEGESQVITHTIESDPQIISDYLGRDDPQIVIKWGTTYSIRADMGDVHRFLDDATTDPRAIDFSYTLDGSIINYEVTIVNADSASIHFMLKDDEEDWEHYDLIRGENTGSTVNTEWDITYSVYVTIGRGADIEETYVFEDIRPEKVRGTVEGEGNAIRYDIEVYDEDVIDLCIIDNEEKEMWLRGLQVIDGSVTGLIKDDPDKGITIKWGSYYIVYVYVESIEKMFRIGDVEISERVDAVIRQNMDELSYEIYSYDPSITSAVLCLWPSSSTQADEITIPISFRGDKAAGNFKFEDKGMAWDTDYEAILYNSDGSSDVLYEFDTIRTDSAVGYVHYYGYDSIYYYITVHRYTTDTKLIVTVVNAGIDYEYPLEEGVNTGDFEEIYLGSDHIFKVYIDPTHTYTIDSAVVPFPMEVEFTVGQQSEGKYVVSYTVTLGEDVSSDDASLMIWGDGDYKALDFRSDPLTGTFNLASGTYSVIGQIGTNGYEFDPLVVPSNG